MTCPAWFAVFSWEQSVYSGTHLHQIKIPASWDRESFFVYVTTIDGLNWNLYLQVFGCTFLQRLSQLVPVDSQQLNTSSTLKRNPPLLPEKSGTERQMGLVCELYSNSWFAYSRNTRSVKFFSLLDRGRLKWVRCRTIRAGSRRVWLILSTWWNLPIAIISIM